MKGRVNQWLWLLSGKEEKLEKIDNQKVKQAIETLDRISLNPEERALYDSMVMARFLQKVRMTKNYEEGMEKRTKTRHFKNQKRNCKETSRIRNAN